MNEAYTAPVMDEKTALIVFQDKEIRRTWFNEEWWFVAADIVGALTGSQDPNRYLKDMRRRDEGFREGWVQIATPLATSGGKQKSCEAWWRDCA